ncbi:hypothetical protein ACW14Y_41230 [Kitasatospora sp. cg17-2]
MSAEPEHDDGEIAASGAIGGVGDDDVIITGGTNNSGLVTDLAAGFAAAATTAGMVAKAKIAARAEVRKAEIEAETRRLETTEETKREQMRLRAGQPAPERAEES